MKGRRIGLLVYINKRKNNQENEEKKMLRQNLLKKNFPKKINHNFNDLYILNTDSLNM